MVEVAAILVVLEVAIVAEELIEVEVAQEVVEERKKNWCQDAGWARSLGQWWLWWWFRGR